MRVLLVSLNFAPEPTGIGKYSGEFAGALVAAGHEVDVVCAPPYYPQWHIAPGHSAWRWRVEVPCSGLRVHRCPTWVPRRPGGLARLLHLASFAASSLPVLLACVLHPPAVVLVVAPALFSAPAAWAVARLAGARCWLHVQDFELDAAFGLGLLRGGLLRRAVQATERWLLRRFDRVSTLSTPMRERLHAKGVPPERTALLPNWVDAEAIHPLPPEAGLRGALGLQADHVVCLYAGTMNRKQGLEVVIAAAERLLARRDIVFVLCGAGEWRARLEALAGGAPNLRFADLQPAERLNALLNTADVHLLPQARGAADLVLPSKLGGMLASGRPVIAAADAGTELATIVCGRGLVVPPEDAQAFAEAVLALADDAALRRTLGAAARSHALRVLHAGAVLARAITDLEALARADVDARGLARRD